MIKTPVFSDGYEIFDKNGHSIISGDEMEASEAVKRINMHDELVKSLRDMFEMAGMAHYNSNWSERYLAAEKLLERCK